MKEDDMLVLVDEKPAGRLYLVFLRSQARPPIPGPWELRAILAD